MREEGGERTLAPLLKGIDTMAERGGERALSEEASLAFLKGRKEESWRGKRGSGPIAKVTEFPQ